MPKAQVSTARHESLDVLRGAAILGILVMNIQAFAMVKAAYINPHALGTLAGSEWWVWLLGHLFFDGKFLALFSMLFGAGVLIMSERATAREESAWSLHLRRMTLLAIFGLAHAYLLWFGDILFLYAVIGMIAFAFREWSTRRLLLAAGFFYMVPILWYVLMAGLLHAMPQAEYRELVDTYWQPSAAHITAEVNAYRGGWLAQMQQRVPDALMMHSIALPAVEGWRILAWMLAGMAAYRIGLVTGTWPGRSCLRVGVIAAATGLPIIIAGVVFNHASGWEMDTSMYFGSIFNHLGTPFVTFAWICLLIALWKRWPANSMTQRLCAIGRGALTCYLLTSVLCTAVFYGHGLGLFGSLDRMQQLVVVVLVWGVLLIIAPAWFRHFRMGPIEWLWRRGVYGDRLVPCRSDQP